MTEINGVGLATPENESATDQPSKAQDSKRLPGWLRSTWPFARSHWIRLALALAAVCLVGALVGYLLSDWLAPNAITDLDVELAEQLASNRTDSRNSLAQWGAFLANTPVKIIASLLVAAWMLHRWKRWYEAAFVGMTLIFEATGFVIITFIVQRPRPDVARLLESPVSTGFPSGHTAAATVYAAFMLIVFWHTRNVWARMTAVVLSVIIPVSVGMARMYQGMHYLSDVVVGVILGIVSLLVVLRIMGPHPELEDLT